MNPFIIENIDYFSTIHYLYFHFIINEIISVSWTFFLVNQQDQENNFRTFANLSKRFLTQFTIFQILSNIFWIFVIDYHMDIL